MKLFEIDAAIEYLMDRAIDEETGEIIDESLVELIQGLHAEKEFKTEQLCLAFRNAESEAEALKAQKLIFAERQKKAEAHRDALKRVIAKVLDGEKFKTDKVAVSWRKSTAVAVSCPAEALPDQYRVATWAPDKNLIKKALQAGGSIDGCELVESRSCSIK